MAYEQKKTIIAAQSGDKQELERLIRMNYTKMYRIAYQWARNHHDAEDITQDACIRLARYLPGFLFQSEFDSWLYRMVVNAALDWHTRDKIAPNGTTELNEEVETGYMDWVGYNAEDRVFAHEVFRYMDKLPANQKSALILVLVEGLSHKQAAEIMECKESTVSWYIFEARKNLEELLKK